MFEEEDTTHQRFLPRIPGAEFIPTEVRLANGEVVTLSLAERGSWVGGRQDGLWLREVRQLNPSGHQTSLISSDYGRTSPQDAGHLFSRWSQENFFRHAMEHFGIDLLTEEGPARLHFVQPQPKCKEKGVSPFGRLGSSTECVSGPVSHLTR